MSVLTGISHLDLYILNFVNDLELGRFCQTCETVQNLLEDDNFWRRRTLSRFSKCLGSEEEIFEKYVNKCREKTWKFYYRSLVIRLRQSDRFGSAREIKEDVEKLRQIRGENTHELRLRIYKNPYSNMIPFIEQYGDHLVDVRPCYESSKSLETIKYLIENRYECYVPILNRDVDTDVEREIMRLLVNDYNSMGEGDLSKFHDYFRKCCYHHPRFKPKKMIASFFKYDSELLSDDAAKKIAEIIKNDIVL